MFEHLPKLTQADLEFMKEVLIDKLITRPVGVEDFEEGWAKICEDLSPEYSWAVRVGANMVSETHIEDPELKFVVNWAVGVAQVALLALVDRRIETDELEKRLRF